MVFWVSFRARKMTIHRAGEVFEQHFEKGIPLAPLAAIGKTKKNWNDH
ncbi:hypothetical protein FACS1894103_6760 [Campylobacterota bacterium]|nr:hypothetical protein FACS1894103_6760 [Campylobacterota bacterium]